MYITLQWDIMSVNLTPKLVTQNINGINCPVEKFLNHLRDWNHLDADRL